MPTTHHRSCPGDSCARELAIETLRGIGVLVSGLILFLLLARVLRAIAQGWVDGLLSF